MTLHPDIPGERLDAYLARAVEELTRSSAQKLIEEGCVLRNGKPAKKNDKLNMGDEIVLTIPEPKAVDIVPTEMALDIVYEDEDVVVLNKPKGLVVHPAAGHSDDTLVNGVLYALGDQLSGINGELRPGIVHRIDKDTSGLLVVAKNDAAHLFLSEQIKEHRVSRIYHAITVGALEEDFTVDLPIGRHPTDRKKMAVTEKNSKNAVTHVSVLERFSGASYIRCELETGRTHQIRVHLSHKNRPLLGDLVYGSAKLPLNQKFAKLTEGQCLHAKELILTHPRTGELMKFTCEIPPYFTEILEALRKTN